jgi:hypothetical protein
MHQDMQGNNQNSRSWIHRLQDETKFAPGELPDTSRGWQQLQQRLQPARKKNTGWYWMAAAMLAALLILLPVLFKSSKNNLPAVLTTASGKVYTADTASHRSIVVPVVQPVLATAVYQKPVLKLPRQQVQVVNTTVTTLHPYKTAQLAAIEIKPVLLPAVASNTAAALVQTAPTKPALKVVHINELGEKNIPQHNKTATDYGAILVGVSSYHPSVAAKAPAGIIVPLTPNKSTTSN